MKNKKTLYISITVIAFLLLVSFIRKRRKAKETIEATDGTLSPITPMVQKPMPVYTHDTPFMVKSPLMKDERVSYIQYKYNQVAKIKGWPQITQDGVYGSETEKAVLRLMGKKTASWNEVLAKANSILN